MCGPVASMFWSCLCEGECTDEQQHSTCSTTVHTYIDQPPTHNNNVICIGPVVCSTQPCTHKCVNTLFTSSHKLNRNISNMQSAKFCKVYAYIYILMQAHWAASVQYLITDGLYFTNEALWSKASGITGLEGDALVVKGLQRTSNAKQWVYAVQKEWPHR